MFLARNARFRWCSRGIWRAVSLAHRLGKWKREAGTKAEERSLHFGRDDRLGGEAGRISNLKFQISNEAKGPRWGSHDEQGVVWLGEPKQVKKQRLPQRQKSRQDAGPTEERCAAVCQELRVRCDVRVAQAEAYATEGKSKEPAGRRRYGSAAAATVFAGSGAVVPVA
jgi:hypothetical protein